MSLFSRIANVLRGDRLSREFDEEISAHLEDAVNDGREPAEARRALGFTMHRRDESHDFRALPWLDSLRADAVFGWRQLMKRKVTSAAAILSLALGIGACTSAFRLIDALLLRPLPVASPERLYSLSRFQPVGFNGKPGFWDGWAYPAFQRMRAAVKDQAELIAVSYADRIDLKYPGSAEVEKATVQYVSGWMFNTFGLKPVVGRLLIESDDLTPGQHPYAVLSYQYWASRFAKDPQIVGRTFEMNDRIYQIIGVCDKPFSGTETGTIAGIFVPMTMNSEIGRSDSTWHRTLIQLKPGFSIAPIREKLNAISYAFEEERAKGFTNVSQQNIKNYLNQTVLAQPAAAGASGLQDEYRRSLWAFAVLVSLVLFIACMNVANLMTAQATSRARELALRVSIGAGRWRLVQLMLVESACVAVLAGLVAVVFAWWSAPFVVASISQPDNPINLSLPADGRVLGFGLALIAGVTLLFGLAPALRASAVKPASALKGGEDPRSRSKMMYALVGIQVAFCFLVLFVAGLFGATLRNLVHLPTGFSSDRLLVLETVTERPQPAAKWDQVTEHLRAIAGVESVSLSNRPLLSGYGSNNAISIDGGPPSDELAFFLKISPGWLGTMKIPLLDGRDFRASDLAPGSAIVNQTFANHFFKGRNPVGQHFDETYDEGGERPPHFVVVGVTRDALYRSVREAVVPVAYVPFQQVDEKGMPKNAGRGSFIVRTANSNPLALADILRREVSIARAEFRVTNIRTQEQINRQHTIRERLLAALAGFFAFVALLLASIGLYGVLDYSVLQRRREIGIRIAIGARSKRVAALVTGSIFAALLAGAAAGLGLGIISAHYIESLLYQVKPTDLTMLFLPAFTLLFTALLASLPPVIRAVRTDPAAMLRSE